MILAWRRVPRSRLLTVFVISYMLVTVAFFVCDRFRLPVVPLMCVFSGFTLHSLYVWWKTRDRRQFFGGGLLIVVAALFVNTNFARLRPDVDFGKEEVQALAALQTGRLAEAAELFGRVATLDPDNTGARVNQGIALWGMGRLDEAAAAFRSGIGADPYPALLNLAHLFFNLQQMDSTTAYAERAIAARPYAPGGYIIAAKALLVQQNPGRAREVLLKGVQECGEDFVYGEYLLAGLLLNEGNLVAADSLYRKVLMQTARPEQPDYMLESERTRFGEELSTVHGKSLHGVGLIFGMRGQLDSSEVYFRAAARHLPTRADILGDWGVCLLRLNRLQEADSVMQRALSLRPDNAAMWFNYGTMLAHKGDLPMARSAVGRALALNPQFPEAQRLFAILSARLPPTARRGK
jgi:tetratricopeptide (TPR) repeat protein